jgi:hypothetical protein
MLNKSDSRDSVIGILMGLRTERYRVRIPRRTRYFVLEKPGLVLGAHPIQKTPRFFPGGKAAGT